MSNSPIPRRNTSYGLPNPLTSLFPEPIVALRSPTTQDFQEVGTEWVNSSTNQLYFLTSIANGAANWLLIETSGGPGVFTSLTVNPGPTLLDGAVTVVAGANPVHISTTDNVASAISLTTNGGTSETIVVTNTKGTGSGAITLTSTAGGITGTAAKAISLSTTDNAANAITLTTNGGSSETIVVTNTQGTAAGAITLKAAAGGILAESALASATAITIEATDAAGGIAMTAGTGGIDIKSGTGAIGIADDATDSTINVGTGGGAKIVSIGSTHTTSNTIIQAGAGTGGNIELTTGTSNSTAGFIIVEPQTGTVAEGGTDTVTVDSRVIFATYTGYTTANSGGTQLLNISSTEILTTSACLVTVTNLNTSGNGAYLTIGGIIQAAGLLSITVINNGAGNLGTGDTINISCWVLN